MNNMKPQFGMIASTQDCAKASLNQVTSFQTFGCGLHEIHGLFMKNLIIEFLPYSWAIKLNGMMM
jgi:hypothetical protein